MVYIYICIYIYIYVCVYTYISYHTVAMVHISYGPIRGAMACGTWRTLGKKRPHPPGGDTDTPSSMRVLSCVPPRVPDMKGYKISVMFFVCHVMLCYVMLFVCSLG